MSTVMETTQKRQRDFYIDLDSRLRKLEAAAAPPPPETKPAEGATKGDPAQETREYEAALGMFKAAKYKEAGTAFMAFVKAHPGSSLLPNAYYWTASSHYQMKDFAKAADAFAKVAATWPNDPKAADALLAQGNALAEAGDAKGSKKALEALVAQYPASQAAQTAKQRLKKK
jgi:tol-pal system protein YbgF